jgi:hypothetical protein
VELKQPPLQRGLFLLGIRDWGLGILYMFFEIMKLTCLVKQKVKGKERLRLRSRLSG